jgi:hypothetical protein
MAEAALAEVVVAHLRVSSGSQAPSRLLQRLGPPGFLPVKPSPPRIDSSGLISSFFALALKLEQKPTWCSSPSSS